MLVNILGYLLLGIGVCFAIYSKLLESKLSKHTTKEYDKKVNDPKRLYDPSIEKYLTEEGKLLQEKAQKNFWISFAFLFACVLLFWLIR